MATIKIKYSELNAEPAQLLEGELAFSRVSDKLFIGVDGGATFIEVGGVTGVETFDGLNLVDEISDTQLYRGEAVVDSLTSDPVWRIRHVIIAADGSSSQTTWASGTQDFDKVWDDRASYVYS